jgi:hypothetical protein
MTRTWHGSCNACTCTTSHHESQEFARSLPRGLDAIGGPACPSSPGGAATFNQQQHRSTGTALGRRVGMYRSTCAVGTTGRRVGGLGCFTRRFTQPVCEPDLAGRFGVRSFSSFGAQPRRQAIAEQPPIIHFQNLRIYDPEAICGEVVSAPFHDGEIQNV